MNENFFTILDVDPSEKLGAVVQLDKGKFRGVTFKLLDFDFSALDEGLPEIKFEVEVIKDPQRKTLKWEKFEKVVDKLMQFLLTSYAESFEKEKEEENENRIEDIGEFDSQ